MSIDEFKTQEGYSCPTCERVVPTSVGLKQHHTKVHDESLVQRAGCIWCGKEFAKRPSQPGRFCSRECFGEHRTENGLPARERKVTITCANCGEDFKAKRSREDTRRHCSNECYHKNSQAEHVECEVCGESFYAHGKRVEEARFCGQDCYGEWLSRNKSGKNSPHWSGGKMQHSEYGPGWGERKRRQVRERDGYTCMSCGMDQDAHLEEHGMRLHVHHEVTARNSSNPAVYNAPRNLTTLCIGCHLERH